MISRSSARRTALIHMERHVVRALSVSASRPSTAPPSETNQSFVNILLLGVSFAMINLAAAASSYQATAIFPPPARLSCTFCEESSPKEEEEEDPYENLPEEDEETHCSMCNTFRKGPCRPFWRKLERCFKDHESEENGAVKCMKYFTPHQECLMKYGNLYHLVSLDMKQELVRDTEMAIAKEELRKWHPPVDWSMWKKFAKEEGLKFRQTIKGLDKDTPLWKRIPENTEPVLITIPVQLPKVNDTGMILKVAYAVDQDGFVLGFTFNKEYGELINQANKNAEERKSGDESPKEGDTSKQETEPEEKEQGEKSDFFDFDFFLLPGETKRVRVCAMYAENPVTASPEKDILDALLYKSNLYSLRKIAEEQ